MAERPGTKGPQIALPVYATKHDIDGVAKIEVLTILLSGRARPIVEHELRHSGGIGGIGVGIPACGQTLAIIGKVTNMFLGEESIVIIVQRFRD